MKKFLLPPLLLFTTLLLSQSKADSLQYELERAAQDTVKVKILHEIYDFYRYDSLSKAKAAILKSITLSQKTKHVPLEVKSYIKYALFLRGRTQIDSAIKVYYRSIELAEKVNFKLGISDAYNGLAYIYLRRGDYQKALQYHQKNLDLAIALKSNLRMGWAYGGIGGIYSEMGEYTKAMEYYILSSKKHEEIGNLKDYSINLANIGMLQEKLGNFKSASQYLKQGDSIAKLIDFQPTRTFIWYALGRLYHKIGDLEQAIEYSKKALASYEKNGQKNQASFTSYTLGTIYLKQGRYHKAIEAFQIKLKIAIEVKDSTNISSAYKAIGDCYKELKELKTAKSNYLNALNVSELHHNKLWEMRVQEALSEVYASEGNYLKAYQSKNQSTVLKDSLYTKEKQQLGTEIEAKYQNERKTREITLLESEKEVQTLQLNKRINERNGIIAFSIIMLVLAGLFYNQYRIKQKANRKLKELDRMKSNFFANISHEFRTPLTLIKGPIEYLEQNPEEQLGMGEIKMIRRNSTRLLKLVNQLLDLSKIDEGSLKLEATEGNIYKCLRAATSSFNSHAAQRNMDYRVQIPQQVLWASFDRDKLEKIVYNLLSNAFKFSEDGALISFVAHYELQELQIKVSDSGRGIPKEQLPFIFDRFFQVDGSTTKVQEGSGIGLSLSKDLVELMDGTITVSSEIDRGSFFIVHIPIQEIKIGQEREVKLKAVGKQKVIRPYDMLKDDKRDIPGVLLVEDNEDMRHFIEASLFDNYKVIVAENGEEGLKLAISTVPDLIITDLMMPKMDGIELCKRLKTDLNTSHIPVIMLTAKAGMDNKIEGLETGADDYLTKPFATKELLVRAKNLIEQRQKLRTLYTNRDVRIDPKKITVTSVDQKFLEQVLVLLEDRFSDAEFGVPQMQHALAMSKTQLHRKLKALTNEAPGELLRNFRLKRAAQLLSQKADSVTQIAYQVGFNNLSYFAKCFKELYGVAPSAF
ncbi:MAG: tetratricopeptide repeat protein [Saonia sp.]